MEPVSLLPIPKKETQALFNLPFLKITFDTSHLDSPDNCVEEFKAVADKVAIIHLSDVAQSREHQPLGSGCVPYEEFLEHLKAVGFLGPVVIEYMPEDEEQLIRDVKRIGCLFSCSDKHT